MTSFSTGRPQVTALARQAFRRAVTEAGARLVEAMFLCEVTSSSEVLSGDWQCFDWYWLKHQDSVWVYQWLLSGHHLAWACLHCPWWTPPFATILVPLCGWRSPMTKSRPILSSNALNLCQERSCVRPLDPATCLQGCMQCLGADGRAFWGRKCEKGATCSVCTPSCPLKPPSGSSTKCGSGPVGGLLPVCCSATGSVYRSVLHSQQKWISSNRVKVKVPTSRYNIWAQHPRRIYFEFTKRSAAVIPGNCSFSCVRGVHLSAWKSLICT